LKENKSALKMGEKPIYKLVFEMSLPPIISLIIQSLYNVVDSIFISGYSEVAFTAISLAFPIQIFLIAISAGMGVGINSIVSRRLGENDYKSANNSAEHGILISLILSVIVLFLGIYASEYFFNIFTDNPILAGYGTTYIKIIMIFSFGRLISQSFISILQGSGNMVLPMVSQIVGAVINIILDPILIYGTVFNIRFCESMGIKGAAIATVIGQVGSLVFLLIAYFSRKHVIKLNIKAFSFNRVIITNILKIGALSALSQSLYSIVVIGLNYILANISIAAVTALGAYYKLQMAFFMPIFGFSAGVVPICGYNYGAKNYDRFKKTVKVGILYSVIVALLGMIIFVFFPQVLLNIFNLSAQVIKVGIIAFRRIGIVFPLSAITIILSSSFQAIGRADVSLIGNFGRSFLVLLPTAYLLFNFVGLDYGWYCFLAANIFNNVYFIINYKKIVNSWKINDKEISNE